MLNEVYQGAIRKRVAPLSFCTVISKVSLFRWTLAVAVLMLVPPHDVSAQRPVRLPVTTGFSQRITSVSVSGTARWLIDQSMVYRGKDQNRYEQWQALPELYRCGAAHPVSATNDQITVVAQRQGQRDTSWWLFRSTPSAMMWSDSTAIPASGQFLCSAEGMLLFSASEPDRPMIIDAYDSSGQLIRSIEMARVRNWPATRLRPCGDSIIALDHGSGIAICEVIRTGAGKTPIDWVTAELPEVIDGKVGDNNAFVYRTSKGTFIDHAGTVRSMRVLTERLQEVVVNGTAATRIANGGIEYAPDVTQENVERFRLNNLLLASTHRILWSRGSDCLLARQDGTLWFTFKFADASGFSYAINQSTDGSVSRGSRLLLSGLTVTLAGHVRVQGAQVSDAVSTIIPGVSACDTVNVRAASPGHEALHRVGNEVWLTCSEGIFSYPDMRRIQQRPGYGAVKSGDMVYMQTTRGIEVRGPADTLSRVLIPGAIGAAMTVMGDTIFLINVQSVPGSEQDARVSVDAYDREGNPFFLDLTVVESAPARSVTLRSVNHRHNTIIINLGRWLMVSRDAGITWIEVDPDVELLTPIDDAGVEMVAWARSQDGRTGPAVMISPDRWVVQPVELRTASPVIACAHMPGWFVFSTADGVWSLQQLISSVPAGNHRDETEFFEGTPDQEMLVDVLGRVFSRESAPVGAYFQIVRFGPHWRVRSMKLLP